MFHRSGFRYSSHVGVGAHRAQVRVTKSTVANLAYSGQHLEGGGVEGSDTPQGTLRPSTSETDRSPVVGSPAVKILS